MTGRQKLPARRRAKKPLVEDERGSNDEAELQIVPGDDCQAIADDADDDESENENDEHEVDDRSFQPVEEGACQVLVERFGDAVRDDAVGSDADSGDDIWNDDVIPDPLSSDSEEETERERREEDEDPNVLLTLGKTYGSVDEFKLALLMYSLKTRYDIKLYMSTQQKIGAICTYKEDKEYSCPWRIYCSYEKSRHKMQVKVYVNEHVCVRSGYTNMLKTSTIAQLFEERLRLNPKLTATEMVAEIKRNYNLTVTDHQCRKAKSKLFRERQATHEAHFSRIWDYQAEVRNTNIGTTIEIDTIPGPTPGSKQRFDRLFVCFTSQRESWKQTCRPIIGLDGAFLKWDIKGHLLAAVERDGDNRIVPIAWAVVEVENDINWDWFVRHLRTDLGLGDGSKTTIISDKQQGLVKAVHNVLPQSEHRLCARHILHNWKRDNHDLELERMFWRIARSYTKGDYADNMEALKRYSQLAYDSLQRTNPLAWSRAFFKVGSFCNDNLNNLNESFNRTIREARRKPLLDLLEAIRRQCMVRNAKRVIIANRRKARYTKSAQAEIEASNTRSRDCIRYMAIGNLNEVEYHGVSYRVDMNEKTCGCGKWQMIGIPCMHATCVIIGKKQRVGDYVSEFYTTKMWQNTYSWGIEPVQGMKLWPRLNRLPVLPPGNRLNNRGRPSNHARKKGLFETSSSSSKTKLTRDRRIMTCSNCREEGHTKLSCANPSVEGPAKKQRGRPRKEHLTLEGQSYV